MISQVFQRILGDSEKHLSPTTYLVISSAWSQFCCHRPLVEPSWANWNAMPNWVHCWPQNQCEIFPWICPKPELGNPDCPNPEKMLPVRWKLSDFRAPQFWSHTHLSISPPPEFGTDLLHPTRKVSNWANPRRSWSMRQCANVSCMVSW